MRKHYVALLLFASFSLSAYAQTAQWAWISGNNTNMINRPSIYGIRGVAAPANKPGGRNNSVSWTDASGNLWLFGGIGQTSSPTSGGGELNDLWKYTPLTNQWTWIGGDTTARQPSVYGTKGVPSSANKPGARKGAVSWTDASGNLWLFGGSSTIARFYLNDLWKYNIATSQWTWVGGDSATNIVNYGIYGSRNVPSSANKPGSRSDAISWTDTGGNLWLFGGFGFARPCYCQTIGGEFVGHLNDLWKYNITSNQWTWVSGDSSIRQQGVYGTRGVPATTNKPGGRQSSGSWTDNNGNLWLYGGDGWASTYGVNSLGDLWRFNIASGLWTYVHGDSTLLQPAVYGTRGVASPANKPGARYEALSWPSTGDTLWFFGGGGPGGYYSDLWIYKLTTNQWTWIAGDSLRNQRGVYDNKAVPSVNTKPGSRTRSVTWRDAGGNLWLHGGFGNTAVTQGYLNDLWKYTLAPANLPGPATFTTNGKVTTEAGGVLDEIEAMKFQPDGKFVVAGTGGGVNFSVARYNADGSLDNTFSGDGKVVTAIGTDVDSRAYDVVIQPDGKIVVAGVIYNEGGFNLDFALVRYNVDGSLDNSFDSDGIVVTDFSNGREDQVQAVTIQGDGKIVVAGWSFNGSDFDFVLARYESNGSLDLSFDGDGKVSTDFGSFTDMAHTVAIQPDGKIVVGGESYNGSNYDFALARYTANGSLDASFSTDGKVMSDLEGHDRIKSLVIQTDGSIVVAGAANTSLSAPNDNTGANANFALARYMPTGNLDHTFDGDGKVTTDLGSNADEAYDLVLQNDGKIVVTGSNGNTADFTIVRYNLNGSLDASFFGNGKTTIDFDNRPDFAHTISIYNNNLYVAGRTAGSASDDFAVAVVTNNSMILPVTLLHFNATLWATNKVGLTWKTSMEQSTSHFEIERSSDGITFYKLGQVAASGTTAGHTYIFTDAQALLTTNYYRIKMVDRDHRTTYSKVVIVKLNAWQKELELFPNPVIEVLQVQTTLKGMVSVTLHDATGRLLKQIDLTSNGGSLIVPVDVSSFKKGAYIINVQGSGKLQSATFIKQ